MGSTAIRGALGTKTTLVRHGHKTAFKDATAGSTKRERTFAFVVSQLDPIEG